MLKYRRMAACFKGSSAPVFSLLWDLTSHICYSRKKKKIHLKQEIYSKGNINLPGQKKEGQEGISRPKPKAGAGVGGLLPPPPGGVKLAPPPAPAAAASTAPAPAAAAAAPPASNVDILGQLSGAPSNPTPAPAVAAGGSDSWGDFTSAAAAPKPPPPRLVPPLSRTYSDLRL